MICLNCQRKKGVLYYNNICKSLNLNPLTRPLEYIKLNGKLTLYTRKEATDQLRKLHKVSITKLETQVVEGVYIVTAYARTADGQEDVGTGAVTIKGLLNDALANAFLKAETKAKRRVTLSICGLGLVDESEVSSIPNAKTVSVDPKTGELLENAPLQILPPRHISNFDTIKESIITSNSMDQLKERFVFAMNELKGNTNLQEDIIFLKDTRKAELDSDEYKSISEGA